MNLIEKITSDLKAAMLARDEFKTTTLRGLKSAILYEEVAKGKRDEGLNNAEIEAVVSAEVKKREDAIKLYESANDAERAASEVAENEILSVYLPKQLSDDELSEIVQKIVADGEFTSKDFGKVMGQAKQQIGLSASSERVMTAVKKELGQ